MNTLANSLWSVNCNGLESGTDTIKFYANGKAIIAFPNGSIAKGSWTEASDGNFVVQSPLSPANPNVNQVYFGMFEQEDAAGHWYEVENMLNTFTMKKES